LRARKRKLRASSITSFAKNTALMLRYTFTDNKEAGDAFNTNGLIDASARWQQLHERQRYFLDRSQLS